jgi:(R,R)-butanediol dehydrogenase/meso-butanediol dehydrogenase/diacetyl reductase
VTGPASRKGTPGEATTRAAVYTGPGVLSVQRRPVPDPGPSEVLADVDYCGVCGSDLHLVVEGGGVPGSVYGHEWSGRVAAVGEGVAGWAVGQPVVGWPKNATAGCGGCDPCRRNRPAACRQKEATRWGEMNPRGAFAEKVVVDAGKLVAVPEGIPLRTAALTEPLAVALHAITLAGGAWPDQRVLITGGGPIGALLVAALRARGVGEIVVSEPAPERRSAAEPLGATTVCHPDELGECSRGTRFDVAYECSGRQSAIAGALSSLAAGGVLVLVGLGMRGPALNPVLMVTRELTIAGAVGHDHDGFDRALDLLASPSFPVEALCSGPEVGLADLQATMARMAAAETVGKPLVRPSA